jgi:hypothetical protein
MARRKKSLIFKKYNPLMVKEYQCIKKLCLKKFNSDLNKLVKNTKQCKEKKCGKIMTKKETKLFKDELDKITKKCWSKYAKNKQRNKQIFKEAKKCENREQRKSITYKKYIPKFNETKSCIKKKCM